MRHPELADKIFNILGRGWNKPGNIARDLKENPVLIKTTIDEMIALKHHWFAIRPATSNSEFEIAKKTDSDDEMNAFRRDGGFVNYKNQLEKIQKKNFFNN